MEAFHADAIFILAVVLGVGVVFGALARRAHLPAVTGQVIGGVLLGPTGLSLFDHHAIESLVPVTHFALGLIAVSVGAHLNVRRLRNAARRLTLQVVFEALAIPTCVFFGLTAISDIQPSLALLLGTIAISTAPATIVALIRETRSRGVFVNTLVAAVALNNVTCIFLFEIANLLVHRGFGAPGMDLGDVALGALVQILKAAATGAIAAGAMWLIFKLVRQPDKLSTAGFIAILLTVGAANQFDYSPLLACLFLGFTQANATREREQVVDSIFRNFEPAILAIFFTLAGMELALDHAGQVGLLALAYFTLRILGKLSAGYLAMRLARSTTAMRQNLGLALLPQAGVAVGLVVLLEEDPFLRQVAPDTISIIVGVVLTTVVANEILGPILTRVAIARSGEAGHDRSRLVDFIHEENIVTGLQATTPEEAIQRLADQLVLSHTVSSEERDELARSALEREGDMSTCLGGGLAVPHGVRAAGAPMVGAMGISEEGLEFETPDGRPVHCVVLLATPPDQRTRHLQVLGMLARTIGSDPAFQDQLYNVDTPAHAYELLHNDAAEDFNYFLEERLQA